MTQLAQTFADRRRAIDRELDRLLPAADGPAATVARAMRHAVFAGGKRLRPILVLLAGEACGDRSGALIEPACAVELLHTYSLIHDDLPAMDDDDLRRGQPTVHRAFGEAEAILAGDALNTLAFGILGRFPEGAGARAVARSEAVVLLARATGIEGMVGGQMADLEAERTAVDAERLDWIHRRKTGALFSACTELGALLAGGSQACRRALAVYGSELGLAFQIVDDILDCTADAATLGKTPGKDRSAGKATFVSIHGLEPARRRAAEATRRACQALDGLSLDAAELLELARWAAGRSA